MGLLWYCLRLCVVEGVHLILSHNLSGSDKENMVYRLDCVVLRAVLMSWYHFLRQVRDISRRESRLDSK